MKTESLRFDSDVFELSKSSFSVAVLEWSNELEKLDQEEPLPRYNRIKVSLEKRKEYPHRYLLLSVHRTGSSLGEKNYYSFPVNVTGMLVGTETKLNFIHFDAFNKPFENIEVSIASKEEYESRLLNQNAFDRAERQILKQ